MDDWCRTQQVVHGATLTVSQVWALSQAWYGDRLSPDFRRRTPAEALAIFASLGLVGPFWSEGEGDRPTP